MNKLKYHVLTINDVALRQTLANWYQQEWQLPVEKTLHLLTEVSSHKLQLQLVLTVNDFPVATAGLHQTVGIVKHYPALKKFDYWLALVYTIPSHRKKGYATLLCQHMEKIAKQRGISKLHLFTATAQALYASMNWKTIQHLQHADKAIAIMEKEIP
ncbi:GNAT family N-acetyltransferase [Pedobacter sp.]|uniref:GNAT family N-acetyltransferase n=1 Tax=Pedobacter sp. TaxID=1411316 RepID=UPI0031DB1F9D